MKLNVSSLRDIYIFKLLNKTKWDLSTVYVIIYSRNYLNILLKSNSNILNKKKSYNSFSRKKTKNFKEKAKKEHEKAQKLYQKRQSKADILAEKELKKMSKEWDNNENISIMPHRPSTVLMALKQKMIRSTSHGIFNYSS